jgi:hypothetical protein
VAAPCPRKRTCRRPVPPDAATSLWLVALLTAAVILPVFLVKVPAMMDYPNHLARMYILSAIGTPEENPYYVVAWKVVPNLAMELIVPPMARLIGVAAATKAFLLLSQILVVSGAVALEMTIKKRHQFAGFVGVAALYSMPFSWGFLNFEFGIGLALWGLASWIALENQKLYTRFVVHLFFVISLFLAHLFAFGLYVATLGLYELYRLRAHKFDLQTAVLVFTILVCPAAVILGYAVFSNTEIGTGETQWLASAKFQSIFFALNGYSLNISALNSIAIFLLLYLLFRSGCLSLTPPGTWIGIGLLVLFVGVPFRLRGSAFVDVRLVTAAFLIMPAFLVFSPTNDVLRFTPPVVLGIIALLNAGHVAATWLAYSPEYAAMKSSFGLIKHRAFVLVGDFSDGSNSPIDHAPVLAVHYANAFVPSLSTIPGQFVLQARAEFKRLDIAEAGYNGPVPLSLLTAVSKGRVFPSIPSFLTCWAKDFDYLYLVGPRAQNPMPDRLTEIAAGKQFGLFRIKKFSGEKCFEN